MNELIQFLREQLAVSSISEAIINAECSFDISRADIMKAVHELVN